MEEILEIAGDVIADGVKDTLLIIPFLLVTYLVMEWLEHKTSDKARESIRKAGAAGPVVGALLGVVPQCGFSTAAATLYAGRVITLGTLFAVFLSTSDEMIPIFIAAQLPVETMGGVLAAKVVIGMVMGFAVDLAIRLAKRQPKGLQIGEVCEAAGCHCEERCAGCEITCEKCHLAQGEDCHGECNENCHRHGGAEAGEHAECCHHHDHGKEDSHGHHHMHEHHEHGAGSIVLSAVKHTLQITVFVLIVNLVLNTVLCVVGEEVLASFIESNELASVFAAGIVGLIPNCAASVAIAELFAEGILNSGAMMAGLLVSAGVGLLVMCRTNRHARENIAIIVVLYLMGVVCGLIINMLGITF